MSTTHFNTGDTSPSGSKHPFSVTEYSCKNVNPSPIKIPKDSSELLEEFLSPRKLQALTGVEDLETVEYLEMRVNTEQMSLGNFGMYLPNLSQIKLSGSYIPSVRDLGTSLWSLQVLWMPQCSLQCLDGLVTMSNLKELYLAYNEIEDISSCGMLENLEILDLEGNLIADMTNVHYLSMCPVLTRLTLEGNPLCNPDNYKAPQTYRKSILEVLSELRYLDDLSPNFEMEAAGGDNSGRPSSSLTELHDTSHATLEFEGHWQFINSVLVESGLLAESRKQPPESAQSRSPEDSGRPSSSSLSYTASSRPGTSRRPFSAQRPPPTAGIDRPLSSSVTKRPDSATTVDSGHGGQEEEEVEDSSLTAGRIVCGSVTKSLRRKLSPRKEVSQDCLPHSSPPHYSKVSIEDCGGAGIEETCDLVLKELEDWRRDYERSKTRIESQRAPQVLTIDYSDEDIEQVDLAAHNVCHSQQPLFEKHHDRIKNINIGESKKQSSKKQTDHSKVEIKLNPVRNGKLPSSWVQREQKAKPLCPPPSSNTVTPPPQSQQPLATAVNKQPTVTTMSRMRRQLIECGVSTMTPSRPLLKK